MNLQKPLSVVPSHAWRSSTAPLLILAIMGVIGGVTLYIDNTLSDIERALPLKILEQRRDIGSLAQQVGELNNLVQNATATSSQFKRILTRIDAIELRLKKIRGTYKLDNLMGAASLHAVVAPMLFDINSWLTDGVNGYDLSNEQVLSLVRTRVADAYSQVQSLVDGSDRLAFSILEGQSRKITSFRIQMMVVFAVLFLVAAALVYYITRINAAQRALSEERQRVQLAIDAANLYDWDWDVKNDRLRWGRDPKQLLGPADEVEAYPNFPNLVLESDREEFLRAGRSALESGDPYKVEFRIRRTDGAIRWLEAQGRRIVNERGETARMIGVTQDITERKHAEQEIHRYAYFDSLTELPNRQQLVNRLDSAIEHAVRLDRKGALLFMDLDHFKNINDSLGHAIGDQLLKKIADRIREVVRTTDLVGRLGGDEFTVLLPDLSQSRSEAKRLARRIGEKIQRRLALPYQVGGHELQVSVSIGISLFPLEGYPVEEMAAELLKNADTAMYRAKMAGRHTIEFFVASMQEAANRKLALQRVIQQALVRDQIRFDFQPQVDLNGGIAGVEALLRLDGTEQDESETNEVIDIAEESGLVLPLGDWVIVRACRHLKQWTDDGVELNRLSINVSPRQFHQSDFVDRVIRILSETGAEPTKLEMEITEGAVMMNVESAIDKMHALKKLGIQFAIDDFGTGYSSLAYLKKLPLDRIKIDQSFTRDVVVDPNDAVIVETIVSMAKNLDLEVIAEGVESVAVFDALKSRSCLIFQGHYFSRPVGEDRLLDMLRNGLANPGDNVRSIGRGRRNAV